MTVNFHLVVTKSGSVRVLKSKPSLGWDEISMEVNLVVPKALFERPQFRAELTIPDTAVQSTSVPVDLTDQLQEIIQQSTGYEVKLSLVPAEKDVRNE